MGYASTTVASGHCPSVRRHLNAGVTVASAGILALGLVAAPPGVRGAGTEVRQVQLAASALSPPALLGALEKFINNQAQTFVPVAQVVAGGAGITNPLVTTPLTPVRVTQPMGSPTPAIRAAAESAVAPAISSPLIDSATLWSAIVPIVNPILGPILAVGLLGFIAVLIAVAYVYGFIGYNVIDPILGLLSPLATSGASIATAEVNPTVAPLRESDPQLSNSAPAIATTAGPAAASRAFKTGKADVTPPVTSTEPATGNEQMSTDAANPRKDVTETAKVDEASAGPAAARAPEPSGGASTSEPVKPTVRRVTPRTVVRDSLGVGEPLRDLPHRGNGGHLTTRTAAAADGAATAGPSSRGTNSSGSDSSGGDSPGGSSNDSR
jgi:hypothetical protein